MMRFFRSLRGRLIVTYTLVTVLALLALELAAMLGLGGIGLYVLAANPDNGGYFTDVIGTLAPEARPYLQPGRENLPALQDWLDTVYNSGVASLPPQSIDDSPAAELLAGTPLTVVAPDGTVLAQSPSTHAPDLAYTPPDAESAAVLDVAQRNGLTQIPGLYALRPDGNYWLAVPVADELGSRTLVGIILLAVEPPPSTALYQVGRAITSLAPPAIAVLLSTGAVLLVAVAPFGALFGFIMSRPLTRRLGELSAAADAWSAGDFTPSPQDRGQDEIGHLGRRLRHMAERVQTLLQTQQALAALQERNRLARDLHDTVKQQSFATLMQVRAARNRLAALPDAADATAHLSAAEDLLKTTQQELSRLIAELRPAALEGLGLPAALRTYVETWTTHSRIPAQVVVQHERALPLECEEALYRVAQEALANVARHSHASAASVQLAYDTAGVTLVAKDNGVGFNQSQAPEGFGLESMRQRLAALGGTLDVASSNEGTSVTARLPIDDGRRTTDDRKQDEGRKTKDESV